MLFSRSKSRDFQSVLYLEDQLLDVVDEVKLLGIIFSSDLKWKKNTSFIQKKCYTKFWTLRRMKEIGGSKEDLLDVYMVQIRCLTELGCASWNGALTKIDSDKIEKIQKVACRIILGYTYINYKTALTTLGLCTLKERRDELCMRFAKKVEQSTKFKKWLKTPTRKTRSNQYILPKPRTASYGNSPLFYIAKLLNSK